MERVERLADGTRVVHVVTAEPTAAACPACGVVSTSVKGRVSTSPRDIPYDEDRIVVRLTSTKPTQPAERKSRPGPRNPAEPADRALQHTQPPDTVTKRQIRTRSGHHSSHTKDPGLACRQYAIQSGLAVRSAIGEPSAELKHCRSSNLRDNGA